VRQAKKQKISIKNSSSTNWKIRANITTLNPSFKNYFSGNEVLEVNSNSSADYEITYLPQTMTSQPNNP
jgi:hypothetical protein